MYRHFLVAIHLRVELLVMVIMYVNFRRYCQNIFPKWLLPIVLLPTLVPFVFSTVIILVSIYAL